MSGGYFPLYKEDMNGTKLLRAANLVTEVIDEIVDDIYGGSDGQFDNSASDGGHVALLKLAIKLILERVI